MTYLNQPVTRSEDQSAKWETAYDRQAIWKRQALNREQKTQVTEQNEQIKGANFKIYVQQTKKAK